MRLSAASASLAAEHVPLARRLARWAAGKYRQNFDDVFSDALYGLTIAAGRHRPERPFDRYASSVIVGEIQHGIRQRAGFRAVRERGEEPPRREPFTDERVAMCVPGPHELVERSELWSAVDQLPDGERRAVRGYYLYGFTQTELAKRMTVSQQSVNRTLERGRRALAGVI